jgi:hypothetical protein
MGTELTPTAVLLADQLEHRNAGLRVVAENCHVKKILAQGDC